MREKNLRFFTTLPSDLPLDDEVMAIGTGSLEAMQSEEKKKVKEGIVKGMEGLMKVAQEKGVNAEVKIVEGVPKVKICEFAEKLKTDVVIMASRGMGAMKRFFLGSNSDYCIHNCPSSVVIVREQDLKSTSQQQSS
mmetsp:Transcript_2494/g.4684  ORF Transcript_2494/g.4684 Transcript_2494/m.4684 type:complete len:136 (-) Transcript_2494:665-1072(-)